VERKVASPEKRLSLQEDEAVAAGWGPDIGRLGDAPLDRALGEQAAGEEAGEQVDGEGGVERGAVGA
jgi:hypothetical protein